MSQLALLTRAELRAIRPLFLLALALGLLGPGAADHLLELLGAPPPAAESYPLAIADRHAWGDLLGLALWLFALYVALRVFAAPRARGRDAFLAGLPLAPWQVFCARALACWSAVAAVALARHPSSLLAHLLSHGWRDALLAEAASLFLTELVASCAVASCTLAFAAAGRQAWLLFGAALLTARGAVHLGWLGPRADLLRFSSDPDPGAIAAWALVGALALAVAYWRFRAPRDVATLVDRQLGLGSLRPLRGALVLFLAVSVPLTLLGSEVRVGPPLVDYPSPPVTAHTEHYRFELTRRLSPRARTLIEGADRLYAQVARQLGLPPAPPERLTIELVTAAPGDPVEPNQLGLGGDPLWLEFGLARRTFDAVSERASGGRLRAWSRALGTLEEGIGRQVAWRATGRDPFWSRFHAAVLHSRRPLRLVELFDRSELARQRGAESAAPLGEALVEAVRKTGGPDALPRLLTALRGLTGRAPPASPEACQTLWGELLAAAGLEEGKLEERLLEVLEDGARDDERAAISLPRLGVMLELQEAPAGWRIIAIPDQDVPPGWYVTCRTRRPGVGSPQRAQRLGPEPNGCVAFFAPSSLFIGPPQVQLGLRPTDPSPLSVTIWEDWRAPGGRP